MSPIEEDYTNFDDIDEFFTGMNSMINDPADIPQRPETNTWRRRNAILNPSIVPRMNLEIDGDSSSSSSSTSRRSSELMHSNYLE